MMVLPGFGVIGVFEEDFDVKFALLALSMIDNQLDGDKSSCS